MSGAGDDAAARAAFAPARRDEVPAYRAMARDADRWLRGQGLAQYVPAAHAAHAAALARLVRHGELHAVRIDAAPVAFFALTRTPGTGWPPDGVDAYYLGGIVVDAPWRGRGLGSAIVEWSARRAAGEGAAVLRLDSHDADERLGRFYAAVGFRVVGRVVQHGGYVGRLQERALRERCRTCRFSAS
jgi:GNAT superfamily N-acetyltransferase